MTMVRLTALVGAGLVWLGGARAGEVSFERDVMAVLSKSGCNMGSCHGNLKGKGGLKLSLRGESPAADFEALVGQKPGKRVKPGAPEESLVFNKPTERTEHEGGKRLVAGSPEWEVVRQWIADGAKKAALPALTELRVTPGEQVVAEPVDRVAIKAEAVFADGTVRDVTRLAVYEPMNFTVAVSVDGVVSRKEFGEVTVGVRYLSRQVPVRLAFIRAREHYEWAGARARGYIDEAVFAKLRTLRMNPSPVCDDATFVRRVTLDLAGRLPTAEEARGFVADTAADRRAKWIDRLLASEDFTDFWTLKWADLLRVEERVLDKKGVAVFHGWLREGFAKNKPLDVLAREILTAQGSTYEAPASNYYRALREPTLRSEAVAQVFLGTRLGCAKCHNHPFERWTQDDYYRFAALFDGLDYKIIENKKKDASDKNMFIGEQIVERVAKKELKDPRTDKAPSPGLLLPEAAGLKNADARFDELAAWMTARENPLFAKVQANRIWSQVMGRGLVEPVDDFRTTNPASIPALLEALGSDFAKSGYDVRHLVRVIANSATYQLANEPNETNADDVANFSHAPVVRLPAEPLLDAVHAVLGGNPEFDEQEGVTRALKLAGVGSTYKDRGQVTACDKFLRTFGRPRRWLNTDTERTNESSLSQIFTLTSGPALAGLLTKPDNRLGGWIKEGKSGREMVDELYWSALTRPPRPVEAAVLGGRLSAAKDPRQALEDVAWAVINSKEFLLRR